MNSEISTATLEHWITDKESFAIFDVREHGEYGAGHIFLATPLPYSQLEQRIISLVPHFQTKIIVYDKGDGIVANLSREKLILLGYTDVRILSGGAARWESAGYSLFEGVNVPSKAFGEQIEELRKTPHISALALAEWQSTHKAMVILDGRPYSEFIKMSIPGGICCPNGELAVRIDQLVPDISIPVVINCAGRTRSIIGAQTLRDLGIKNPVFALENGTQGWMLHDLPLQHGRTERYRSEISVDSQRQQNARKLAEQHGVEWVTPAEFIKWQQDPQVIYLFDVRTDDEYLQQTIPGARHAPGGQLQQATDHYIAVRQARVVLFDNDGIRAAVTAAWLRQLGHQAFVLQGGLEAGLSSGVNIKATRLASETIPEFTPSDLSALRSKDNKSVLWDIRSSEQWMAGHLAESRWVLRPAIAGLASGLPEDSQIIFITDNQQQAGWAALDLSPQQRKNSGWLSITGLEETLITDQQLSDEDRIDYLFFTHDRHQGNKASARQYLSWEKGLWGRLTETEKSVFNF